ncbi:MAG TPA: four helix bundle protein [Thermoanaerobaculia bacterium]|nr:four helix bundle protein [Thermoanaerobaculia bacterium]
MAFDHEKLDVDRLAIEFVAKANDIMERLPRGRGYLGDQLQRAALSIVLNIAEGAGKFLPPTRPSSTREHVLRRQKARLCWTRVER